MDKEVFKEFTPYVVLSFILVVAKYLSDLGISKKHFSILDLLIEFGIGVPVAMATVFICYEYGISPKFTGAVTGIATLSARVIITLIPQLLVKFLERKVK